MVRELLNRARDFWGRRTLRRDWPWVLVVVWLLARVLPGSHGCMGALGWLGLLVLLVRGLRLLWMRLLFRVSRRLWAILVLLAAVPAAGLVVVALSAGWLAIGGQAARSFQATVQNLEDALAEARRHPEDRDALLRLRGLGPAKVVHVPQLPEGVKADFVGLVAVKDSAGTYQLSLKAISQTPRGYRILSLGLESLPERLRSVVGGRLKLRLDPQERSGEPQSMREEGEDVSFNAPTFGSRMPLATWVLGEPVQGRLLFHPFNLPPMALSAWDWQERRYLTLTAVVETHLGVIFKGYRLGEAKGNVSGEAMFFIGAVLFTVLFLGIVELGAFLLGMRLAWSLGRHVDALDAGVRSLRAGNLATRIRVRSQDQLGRLAQDFNGMAAQLEASMAERELRLALEEELRVAREVQMRLLPDLAALDLPEHIAASILPAKEVAGDWYDFHRLPDGRIAFLIADVSGKGTSAAFYAAETKGMLAVLDKVKRGPQDVAVRINDIWCATHGKKTFITLCYGIFDPARGAYEFVRCGHPAPFLRRKDGTVRRLHPGGLGIGLTANGFRERLDVATGVLEPGDALLLYTDGLSEAQDSQGTLYGEDRIEACLARTTGDPLPALLADVHGFTGDVPLADDLTVVVLRA